MTASALYRGHLLHARRDEHRRRFRYPIVTVSLDLDELPALDRRLRLFSHNRPNLWSLHDRDYTDAASVAAHYQGLLSAAGAPPPHHARLVTQLRTANWVFNPVSFFLAYDPDGVLTAAVADVRNTYGGRHAYVLDEKTRVAARPGRTRFRVDRVFFVSPFLHGEVRYDFEFPATRDPEDQAIHMDVTRPDGATVLVAHLSGTRTALTDRALAAAALRYPLMSVQTIALIYGEAVWNHLRRVPFRRPDASHRPRPL